MNSRVEQLLGIRYPIIQGPFGGGISSVQLAAAVSNLGGLGSFGANIFPPEEILAIVAKIRALTPKPFSINLWVPLPGEEEQKFSADQYTENLKFLKPYYDELKIMPPEFPGKFGMGFDRQVEALLKAAPPVASFIFGVPPREVLSELRKRKIISIGTATTVDEAVALDDAGIGLIVASGSEAGGHRAAFLKAVDESVIGTMALVPQVVSAVKAPVAAAGGIADGRGAVAAFALGAEAVQIGTAFLACDESGASEIYKQQLTRPGAQTRMTRVFSGRHARGIVNRFMAEMQPLEDKLPPYPIQNWMTQPIRRAAAAQGRSEFISLWAGQAAGLVKRRPVADFFAGLLAEIRVAQKHVTGTGFPDA